MTPTASKPGLHRSKSRLAALPARSAAVAIVLLLVLTSISANTLAGPATAPAMGKVRAQIVAELKEKMPDEYARLAAEHGAEFEGLASHLDGLTIDEASLGKMITDQLSPESLRTEPYAQALPLQSLQVAVNSWLTSPDGFGAQPAPRSGLGAPSNVFYDFYPTCDLNADGLNDIVATNYDFVFRNFLETGQVPQRETNVFALDGADGHGLWRKSILGYTPNPVDPLTSDNDGSDAYSAPSRQGMPNPQWPLTSWDVFQPAEDLNGNGACDFLGYGTVTSFPLTPFSVLVGILWMEWNGEVVALDGKNGQKIWSNPINSVVRSVFPPPIPCAFVPCPNYEVFRLEDYPTGWEYGVSPSGPKVVWKTTDVQFNRQGGQQQRLVQEDVSLLNAVNGKAYWTRQIFNPDTGVVMNTWLSGVGDMIGTGELEIVLEQTTPLPNGPPNLLVSQLFVPGTVYALLGELDRNGVDLWRTTFVVPQRQGQGVLGEGGVEVFLFQYSYVIGDANQDGWDDVVGSYLVGPPNGKFPMNEDYKVHVHPLSGNTGAKFWPQKDIKVQGWGVMDDMNVDANVSQPYLVIGTVDVPTPQLPGTKFPPKNSRITVLDAPSGEPRFIYRERYGLDSYFSFDLALRQFFNDVAPRDFNLDGIRDPVTPARYRAPAGAAQVLTANTVHDIFVIDALRGKPISVLSSWGPNGQVVPCAGEAQDSITIISGHSRRFDLHRYNITSSNLTLRQPLYNNPTPQSPTAGQEMMFLAGRCGDGEDNRTMFGFSAGVVSLRRGFEVIPAHGFLLQNTTLDWLSPTLIGNPPIDVSIDYLFTPPKPLSVPQQFAIGASPVVPGFAIGFGLGFLSLRRKLGGA